MDKSLVSSLLGRSLTVTENTNFKLYLNIAKESLDDILCTNLCDDSDTRIFDANEGYSTVWVDIFTEVSEVKINGNVVDNYTVRQNDRRNGSWYNSLVFNCRFSCDEEVEVTADFGFDTMPNDLQAVWAGLFDLVTKKNRFDGTIQSKQVEDFRITFNTDTDLDAEFYKNYGATIDKYSNCNKQGLRHGRVKC